jgi:hypothetical protein
MVNQFDSDSLGRRHEAMQLVLNLTNLNTLTADLDLSIFSPNVG